MKVKSRDMKTSLEVKYEGYEGRSLTLTHALPSSTSYVVVEESRWFCGQGLLWMPGVMCVADCVRWVLANTDKYSLRGFAKSVVTALQPLWGAKCPLYWKKVSVVCQTLCDSVQIMFLWLVATNVLIDSTASLDLVSHEYENISNYSMVQDLVQVILSYIGALNT